MAAPNTFGEIRFYFSLIINHCWRHNHNDKKEVDWDQYSSKYPKSSDWHYRTECVSKEGNSSGARCHCHCSDTSSKSICHSLFDISLYNFLTHVSALLPGIDEDKYIVCSYTNYKEYGDNLKSSKVRYSSQSLNDHSRKWET